MSTTGVHAFDHVLHTSVEMLNDLSEQLGWNDRDKAYRAFRSVMQALRDRLEVNAVAHLGAQLPLLLRGVYYENWHPAGKPLKEHKAEFLAHVEKDFESEIDEPEQICRGVFTTLKKHVSRGEIDKVKACLPEDLRQLWRS